MDKELIEHITTKLQNHEEPYSPGAWERFNKKEAKPKGFVYWPLWTAAALILIIGSVLFALNNNETENTLVKNKPQVEHKKDLLKDQVVVSQTEDKSGLSQSDNTLKSHSNNKIVTVEKNSAETRYIAKKGFVFLDNHSKSDDGITLNYNLLSNNISRINLSTLAGTDLEIVAPEKKAKAVKKTTFEELLAQDSKANQYKNNSKNTEDSKWQPGVYIAPSMGNDNKVNMNYGFSLSYNVAKKLSISSGIAYSALSSTGLPGGGNSSAAVADAPSTSSIAYSNTPQSSTAKSLESVNASLGGINIPLEIRYNFNDKFYSGIGVSAFAVLNSKQQNNYISNQFENRSVTNAMGFLEQKTLVVQEKITESVPESNLDPDKYIGFYNFSLGYKQKISKKNSMSVEPFLRLPMKTFSNENLNLTNGGIRLKVDF